MIDNKKSAEFHFLFACPLIKFYFGKNYAAAFSKKAAGINNE